MTRLETLRRTVGINFTDNGEADVAIWAPLAEKLAIVLTDNKEQITLERDAVGFWRTVTDKIKPGQLYKLNINDEQEFPDPTSIFQPEGVHGPSSAANLLDIRWRDSEWKNLPLKDYIIYELHTGTFTDKGTFEAIGDKIAYLKELGVNAIEIMPVAQFPGSRNWGYDGVFPYAVQNSYGGYSGLQNLVQLCHENEMAVILDVVYNHMGPEGNYLGAVGPYFTDKYKTPWGNAINFDDEYCDGVRQYFIENVLMWFRDFHIDALRLDAVHAIKDFSPTHILKEIKLNVDKLMATTGRQHYLIVELDLNDTRFINPIQKDGYGMDAQWIDEFHHALRVCATNEQTGYYADFTGIEHLAKAYKDAYVYDGIYSPHRKKNFGVKAENNPGNQFIVFSQNHDQVGNRMLGERTSALVSFEMQKLLAAAVVISPYLPMLFMGEEYSESNPFLYFVSHTDAELAEAVRKGRKAEFAAFHAEGEAPDPVAVETFNQSKLQWDKINQGQHKIMLAYYKKLLAMRKSEKVLSELDRHQLNVQHDTEKKTLLLHRWYQAEHIVSILNFSKKVQEQNLPDYNKVWMKIFDSADPKWNGPSTTNNPVSDSAVTIQPESILMFKIINN